MKRKTILDTTMDTTAPASEAAAEPSLGASAAAQAVPEPAPAAPASEPPAAPAQEPPAPASAPAQAPMGGGGGGGDAPTPQSTINLEPREFEVHEAAKALRLRQRVLLTRTKGRRDVRGRLWAPAEKIAAAAGLEPGLCRMLLEKGCGKGDLPAGAEWAEVTTVLPGGGAAGRLAGRGEGVVLRLAPWKKTAVGDEIVVKKSTTGAWREP